MVKHIKGWDLSAKLDHHHNIYVQNFTGAKVGSMKDYTKPCTHEENPDRIILYVGISDNSPEQVGKSIVDLVKNLFHDNRKVTISGLIPRNDEWNKKAELVNNHLKEMCKSANIDFIDNSKNFNPKKHTNNSKLHLNGKVSYKLSNILVKYISIIYKWHDVNKPFVNIISNDITSNIFDVCTESVSKTAPPIRNPNLESECLGNRQKSLRTSNLHRIIIAQININSIRNKFEALVNGVRGNVDILMISETKIDDSFPLTQFLIEGFTTPYRLDRNGSDRGILVYIRADIPV